MKLITDPTSVRTNPSPPLDTPAIAAQVLPAQPLTPPGRAEAAPTSPTPKPFERFVVQENGIDALVMCGANPRKAIISFSSMSPGKYERWSWFFDRHMSGSEDLYIVFKDESHHYYLGDDQKAMNLRHHRFISGLLEKNGLGVKETYLLGSSMGGYAALYFGFWLDVGGIIAINPQIDYASTRRHSLQNWERKIREVGSSWVDMHDFVYRYPSRPRLHLEHGEYPADVSAVNRLVASLDDLRLSYNRNFVAGDHSTNHLTRERLFQMIDFWSS